MLDSQQSNQVVCTCTCQFDKRFHGGIHLGPGHTAAGFSIMIGRGHSGRDRKNLQRGNTTFSVSRWSALAAAAACTWKYSVCLSVLLFSRWSQLSFAFAVPRFLCLSPSPTRHRCLHQVRYCSLSLSLSLSHWLRLAVSHSLSLAFSHSLSLTVSHSLSLVVSYALSLAVCHSLSLAVCHSLSLAVCHSLSLSRYLSLALATALCASLSLSHIHSRHTLCVQARCELTADHRVNDNWVLV